MSLIEIDGRPFELDPDNQLHSVRADLRPSRGPTDEQLAASLVAGALAEYGVSSAKVSAIGAELVKEFANMARLEKTLQERECAPPRPSFIAPVRAALSQWRGEGFWERG